MKKNYIKFCLIRINCITLYYAIILNNTFMQKERLSITLDPDIAQGVRREAKKGRQNVSAYLNVILARILLQQSNTKKDYA